MFPSTQNFFANRDPYRSRIYNPPTFNHQIINKLKSPYHDLATWQCRGITKISSIASCEITNNITPSPTEFNRDVFLQSGLPYNEYTQATKLKDIAEYDPNLCDKLDHYQQRFAGVGFKPLHEFPALNTPPFDANANDIISQQLQIYHHLNSLATAPNTCMIFESHHLLKVAQITQSSVSSQPDENNDDEDDAEPDYTQRVYEYESSLSDGNYTGWSSGTQAQSLQHWYEPLGAKTLNDETKLFTLVYGYIGQQIDDNRKLYYDIPVELVRTFILFSYGVIYTIESMMRMYIEKMKIEPFTFKHYEAQFRDNNMQILEVNDSKVPNCVIAFKLNAFMIFNSVHSMHNFINTLTFEYIKYHDKIMIYSYITAPNGKSYGNRIDTINNLITFIQSIFPNQTIDIKDTSLVKEFESAKDPILEQHRRVLFKEEIKAEPSLLNSFHKEIKDIVDECNQKRGRNNDYYKWLILEDILSIFQYGGIDKEFFIDINNRSSFIQLLQGNGISTNVGDIFWHRLGGAAGIDGNAHVIEEKADDIESELEHDLQFIQQNHDREKERDEDEEDQEKQEELDVITKGNKVESGFEDDDYFWMEYPLWQEYKNNDDELQIEEELDIQQHLMQFWISNNRAIDDLDGYLQGNDENENEEDDDNDDDKWNGFEFPPDYDQN